MTPNTYALLADLVVVVGIIAAIIAAYCVRVILRSLSPGRVHAWLDRESDTMCMYMEAERERRNEVRAYGKDRHNSPLGYYGLMGLVERRLFVWQYDAASALNRWQLQPEGTFDGQDWKRF